MKLTPREKDKLLKQIDFMKINRYNFTYTNYLTFSREKKEEDYKEILKSKVALLFVAIIFILN